MTNNKTEQIRKITEIRDSAYSLIINEKDELQNTIYFSYIKHFMILLEGIRHEAYLEGIRDPNNESRYISAANFYALDDSTQTALKRTCTHGFITTVGIGINIERESIRNKFNIALSDDEIMHRVYRGQATLTNTQIIKIFKICISECIYKLHNIYKDNWRELKANERIAILSLYFNSHLLVNEKTNFKKNIDQYIETNNAMYLQKAMKEVLFRSNPKNNSGLKVRRFLEAIMLTSYEIVCQVL